MIENARSEREMAALMQEAVDCLPNGFSILDENLLPIMANQVCRTSFPSFYQAAANGLIYREASFSVVRQAMPDAPLEEILRILDRLTGELMAGGTINFTAPDGKIFKTTYHPMSHNRTVAVSIDVTELAQREKELLASRRQAEAANQAKSSFLANMSHEIRTPLNGILGMAQVLVQGNLRPEQHEQVEIILESGKTLKALLDDVLDLSKIEAGRMELSPVDTDVTVASEPGKGSTVTLSLLAQAADTALMAVTAPAAVQPEQSASFADGLRGKRVLLVDDHPLNRRVVQLFLAPAGYRVTEAENGQIALDRLAEQTFDVVLLDMHMPVLDGIQTLRHIRASATTWRDIPVIALTADAMSGDRERYLAEGMNGYVAKPIDQRDLLAEIVRLIGRAKPAGTPEVEDAGPAMDAACRPDADAVPPSARAPAARVSQEDLNSLFSTMDVPRKAAVRTR